MRKLMWFSVGFAVACALGAYIFPEQYLVYALIAVVVGIGFVIGCHFWKALRVPAMVLVAFAVGTGWFMLYNSVFLAPARELDSRIQELEMEVTDQSEQTDYGCTVSAEVTLSDRKYPVIVYFQEMVDCSPGDVLQGVFSLRFTAEGSVKDPTYHRGEGVFLLAYPSGPVTVMESADDADGHFAAKLRIKLIEVLESIFPKDSVDFAKALLLGDRSGIDYETSTAFKVSGISHIIAVSGLHVSILFGILVMLSGRNRYILFFAGIPLLVLFAAVAGFTPSIIRACIMQGLMLTALILNKEYDPPTALATAALVMLVVNPMVIISVSFQLSFGCMIGIFLFSKRIYIWLSTHFLLGNAEAYRIVGTMKRWFCGSVSVSLGASVVTTPLVAVYFGTVSLISVVTNILVVWVIAYIFYGIILASGVSLLSIYAGRIAAWVVSYPIRFVIGVSKTLMQLPLAAVYTESVYIVAWLIFAYVLLLVFLFIKNKPVLVFSCLTTVCLCASLIASWVEPLLDNYRITVLDIGQGQCILLQSEGKTFLVDCGGSGTWSTADKASEYLLSQGVSKLDGIVVTHYDEDHAGALPYFLTRIPADNIYLPLVSDECGVGKQISDACSGATVYVDRDLRFAYGNTVFTIFGPESYNLDNESSLCVLFQPEDCDILITGDRGSLGESLLLNRGELPEVDILVAGHHGSAGSTGEALLDVTSPEYVLISSGRNNRYGHPSKELLERLAQYKCIVLRTDLQGTIVYRG